MDLLSLEQFAGCINETFSASFDGMDVPFVLVEARPVQAQAREVMRAPFSLLFRNASAFLFPQRIYAMRHPRVGDIGIFLVPIARDRDGFIYQALFN